MIRHSDLRTGTTLAPPTLIRLFGDGQGNWSCLFIWWRKP